METPVQQNTLRDELGAGFDAAETSPPPSDRARDEVGRFAKTEVAKETPIAQEVQRPITTWKKEYLPLYDKLAGGQALTPDEAKRLAEYSVQRENDFKTGVSTYRTEALAAKELQEAITPFMPDLQAHGVAPAQWIRELGQAHQVLVRGNPQQKFQALQMIARRYGVPLQAVQGGVPPIVGEFMQQLQALTQKVNGVESKWTQAETTALQGEVEKLAGNPAKYPHFEAVREQMAQLLETGLARDLDSAYDQAIYLNPEVRSQVLSSTTQAQAQANVVARAKARAVSPKSATPSGQAKAGEAKDRRSTLSELFDSQGGGRV